MSDTPARPAAAPGTAPSTGAPPGNGQSDGDGRDSGRGRGLDLDRTVMAALLMITFAVALRPATDNDLWWHLASGRWMVDHHAVLRSDPFTHTMAGVVRQPADWLGQLGLYGTWRVGGGTAVAVLVALLATLGTGLVAAACRGPIAIRATVVALVAGSSSIFWSARPQMVTFALTALVVLVLRRFRARDGRRAGLLWWLVPVFALWSNIHLGWFYGLAVMWATVAGEAIDTWRGRPGLPRPALRVLAWVSAAATAAVVINPVGPRIFTVVATQVSVGRRFIQENQPPSPSDPSTWPFFALLAIVVVAVVADRRRLRCSDGLLVAGTALAALGSVRTVPLFATVAAPVACEHLTALVARRRVDSTTSTAAPVATTRSEALAHAGLLVMVAAVALTLSARKLSDDEEQASLAQYPVAATRYLATHPAPGRLWNTFDWGGYLIWHLPSQPVSIDGRADLHADRLAAYERTLRGVGWRQELDREGIGHALVETGGPLARAMSTDPAWRAVHTDPVATVFVRRGT